MLCHHISSETVQSKFEVLYIYTIIKQVSRRLRDLRHLAGREASYSTPTLWLRGASAVFRAIQEISRTRGVVFVTTCTVTAQVIPVE